MLIVVFETQGGVRLKPGKADSPKKLKVFPFFALELILPLP